MLLPTPQANDALNPHAPRLKKDRETRDPNTPGSYRGDLKDVIMFPTPKERDFRSPRGKSSEERHDPDLNTVAFVSEGKPIVGQLNADWVSLLMGFEKDWTVVEWKKVDARNVK